MRAEIAAALLHNPEILFLDEPTIGLDIVAKRQIREFIRNLNKENNTTVILTTHDMKDVEELCERIILIDKGSVVVDAAMSELKHRFTRKAVLNVGFSAPVHNIDIENVNGTSTAHGLKWRFELDKDVITTGHFLFQLSQTIARSDLEMLDIEINEPAIEDIIHDIYKNGLQL
jgi:ABC-2 type transport system ATP-binding protein